MNTFFWNCLFHWDQKTGYDWTYCFLNWSVTSANRSCL